MSLHLVARTGFPKRLSISAAAYFVLGQSSAGEWVIRETTGRKAGLFRTREAAIKFARDESAGGNFTILHEPNGLEFEQQQLRSAA